VEVVLGASSWTKSGRARGCCSGSIGLVP